MNLWARVLDRIEPKLNRKIFETWFRPTKLLSESGSSLTIQVPHLLFEEWLSTNYMPLIQEELASLGRPEMRIEFQSREAEGYGPAPGAPTPSPPAAETAPAEEAPAPPDGGSWGQRLNSRYSFANFVVGSCNQLAHAAAMAVAEAPATSYNPLYLYGGTGLGKTHLMQAIGNHLRGRNGGFRIHYTSAERFMNEMITAIRFKRTQEFRNRYRSADLLLIDDIQFLAGKEGTQEEFFHTFNDLYEAQKQVVISSDCPPRGLSPLEDRLRSRFEWGLIADLQAPDVETKVAILRKKSEVLGTRIPDEVALFIASKVKSSVRELEGCLTKVLAYSSLTNRPIDQELAHECLKDILGNGDTILSVERIMEAVADRFRLKPSDLKARSNAKAVAEPRQIAMYLCKTLLDTSYPELGRRFGGKHHSTVIHSVRKVERLSAGDETFRTLVHSIRDTLQ